MARKRKTLSSMLETKAVKKAVDDAAKVLDSPTATDREKLQALLVQEQFSKSILK